MKKSNILIASIFLLIAIALALLLLAPDHGLQQLETEAPGPASLQDDPSMNRLPVSPQQDLHTEKAPRPEDGYIEPDSATLALHDLDLRSLDIHHSPLTRSLQRNRLLAEFFGKNRPENSLIPGQNPEDKVAMHKRMDELQEKASKNSLERHEQIEFLKLRIQKKQDHLEIQRRVQEIYGEDAPMGPAGDYDRALQDLEKEIQDLEEQLHRVETTGHSIQ